MAFALLVVALHDLPGHRRLVCFVWLAWSGNALSEWGGRQLAGQSIERAWSASQAAIERGLEPVLRNMGIDDPSAHWRAVGSGIKDQFAAFDAEAKKDVQSGSLIGWIGGFALFGVSGVVTLFFAWLLSGLL